MNIVCITFRSVTLAQRGERILKGEGIRCGLQRIPRWMEERGCGYCLRLPEVRLSQAVAALRQQQAHFRRIYRMGEGNEEVVL